MERVLCVVAQGLVVRRARSGAPPKYPVTQRAFHNDTFANSFCITSYCCYYIPLLFVGRFRPSSGFDNLYLTSPNVCIEFVVSLMGKSIVFIEKIIIKIKLKKQKLLKECQ